MPDYSRFADRARKTMQLANQEAQRLGHSHLDASHIFIGLCREGGGVAAKVFKRLRLDESNLMRVMRSNLAEGDDWTIGRLPHTPTAAKVVESAVGEAKNMGHNYVGTEHLLLGLLSYSGTIATLAAFGVTEAMVREAVAALWVGDEGSKKPSETAMHIAGRVWCDQEMRTVAMDTDAAMEIATILDRVREKQAKQSAPTRLDPPPGLVHAIQSEPLVAAVWMEAQKAGASVEVALTAVALELLAGYRRMRWLEVERLIGKPRVVWVPDKTQSYQDILERVMGCGPTVIESAP